MHNFAAHVNRRAKGFQGDLHNVDRAHHTRAKTARLQQQHPLLTGGSPGVGTVGDSSKQRSSHISQYTNRSITLTAKKGASRSSCTLPRSPPPALSHLSGTHEHRWLNFPPKTLFIFLLHCTSQLVHHSSHEAEHHLRPARLRLPARRP